MTVPYTFATATSSIPLSQLDSNFATAITLGNTAVYLGNTTTSIGNLTLTNTTISSVAVTFPNSYLSNSSVTIGTTSLSLGGTASTLANVTLSNVTISSVSTALTVPQGGTGLTTLTAGYIPYGNGTSAFSSSSSLYFDGTNLGVGTTSPNGGLDVNASVPRLVMSVSGTAKGQINIAGSAMNFTANDATYPMTFNTGGGERMRIDTSGNVGIGTSSPAYKLDITGGVSPIVRLKSGTSGSAYYLTKNSTTDTLLAMGDATSIVGGTVDSLAMIYTSASIPLSFYIGNSERMRIDSSGNLLVGTTAQFNSCKVGIKADIGAFNILSIQNSSASLGVYVGFLNSSATTVGSISYNGATTLYNATSDYRLKTVIGDIVDAGKRIDTLQPIEYDWNTGGRTRGFLAHQFAEVYPNSVSGEKDAVDEEGKPVYQSMQASSSEVMADLIAEIQSLRKRVAQLESK